jgi:16S rRNA (adenine1518-N6/adenine1519-N6)-dimethyltransferase
VTSLRQTTIELLNAFERRPRKKLGQNFLIDENSLKQIIAAAQLSPHDNVLEIGTGLGVLTGALAERAGSVTTLDPDKEMIQISKEVLSRFANIEYLPEDFLKWEPARKYSKVVANVPYYITSPIIEKLLSFARLPELIVLTVQKEVAERITSAPGGRKYGSFSVFVQNRAEAKIGAFIPKRAFFPQPNVDSAVLVLKPYEKLLYKIKEEIVRTAFSQRRKMLRGTLSEYKIDFDRIGIDPRRRPETLSLAEFEKISQTDASF